MKFAIFGILFVIAAVAAKDGSVSVYNSGGYVATFKVQYFLNGEQKSESSGDISLGVTKTIRIPDGAYNIFLHVQEYWFIGSLANIFTDYFESPEQKCYKIWGTTLSPQHSVISC